MHDWLLPDHGRLAGTLPVGLNAQGVAETHRLADLLSGEPLSWVVSSPLRRTKETAEIIAGIHGLNVEIDDRLTEWRLGAWEGLEIEEIRRRYPAEWEMWRNHPERLRLPDAEQLDQVAARMEAAYRAWAGRGGTGLLVSHQDPLAALLCMLIGARLSGIRSLDIETASLSKVIEMPYGTVIGAINVGRPLS